MVEPVGGGMDHVFQGPGEGTGVVDRVGHLPPAQAVQPGPHEERYAEVIRQVVQEAPGTTLF